MSVVDSWGGGQRVRSVDNVGIVCGIRVLKIIFLYLIHTFFLISGISRDCDCEGARKLIAP